MIGIDTTHPILLATCACLALVAGLLLLWRRRLLGIGSVTLLTLGAICAAIAAGGLRISVPSGRPIQVLVDLSPSTRTAEFRDDNALKRRIGQLLGGGPYELVSFDDRPTFAGPCLLFSDGRFPAAPADASVFCVVDPVLSRTGDARLSEHVTGNGQTTVLVENSGGDRLLRLGGQEVNIRPGRYRLQIGPENAQGKISLDPSDAWPENDTLELLPQPTRTVTKLACGLEVAGLEQIASAAIPSHASAMASTSILLLDAGQTAQLSDHQQQAIASWVRNLGGSLVVVGQDDGWASLRRSRLGEISPLSPDPPTAAREWVILIDASGSMAQSQDGQDKFAAALAAGQRLLLSLPRNDLARIGLFSTDVRWIAAGTVSELELAAPASFIPRGPTNLDRALENVLALSASKRELILLTDAEVELPDAAKIIDGFRSRDARVSCLMLSDGRGKAMLQELAGRTGGAAVTEVEPRLWAGRAGELAGRLAPARWRDGEIEVVTSDPLPGRRATVRGHSEAFLQQGAVPFAEAADRPVAASWQVGLGNVAAVSFPLPADWAAELAAKLEREPSDDRYSVEWLGDRVRVDGPGSLGIRVHIAGVSGETDLPIEGVAPGRFEAELPDLSAGAYVVVLADQRIVDRRTFSPTYPREFAAIGNDLDRLQQIAAGSGGRVIGSDESGPIPELRSRRFVSLVPFFGFAGVALLASGVVLLRRRV